jgi:hypothetical protein
MIKQILVFVAVTTLAAKLARRVNQRRSLRRPHDERRMQRDDVHRWEAEGGNLPVTPRTE